MVAMMRWMFFGVGVVALVAPGIAGLVLLLVGLSVRKPALWGSGIVLMVLAGIVFLAVLGFAFFSFATPVPAPPPPAGGQPTTSPAGQEIQQRNNPAPPEGIDARPRYRRQLAALAH